MHFVKIDDDWFAKMEAKDAARPWWNKAYRRGRWAWERFHYQWLMKNQQRVKNKIKHGFWGPDEDGFEFHSVLARWALPRLKQLAQYNHGYPGSFIKDHNADLTEAEADAHGARWEAMLADMIYFLEIAGGDTVFLEGEAKNRYRKGKFYFFKYFESLWN